MAEPPIPRSLENKIEIAVTRWTDALMQRQGLSRRQASEVVLDLVNSLADGRSIVTPSPENGT